MKTFIDFLEEERYSRNLMVYFMNKPSNNALKLLYEERTNLDVNATVNPQLFAAE